MRRLAPGLWLAAVTAALLWMAACRPARLQMTPPAPGAAPPMRIPAPTPTGGLIPTATPPAVAQPTAASLTLWVNETSAGHETALQQIVADFRAASGIDVELRLVAPRLLPDLVQTAAFSEAVALPDLILHPVEYSVGWAEQGILDRNAAAAALETLGADTFNQEALALVTDADGPAALPSSGYPQLIIYRQDWFTAGDLAPPVDFAAMLAGAAALFDRDNFVAGFVVPTESNLVGTHQVFEHMAMANGCQLVDATGRVQLLSPSCQQALDFYFEIIHNYSPIGVQTDTSTRNAYLGGRAAIVISSPALLPLLAGLDPAAPPSCPECEADPAYLAQNSGFLTRIAGPSAGAGGANFGNLTYLGITSGARREAAVAFVTHWFEAGYETWLRVETERKVPLRLGTSAAPRANIDAWGTYPLAGSEASLQALFGPELVAALLDDVAGAPRWGLSQGQGALTTRLYESLTMSVVLQEMLSGYFDPEETLIEAYNRVIDLIPGYPYERETDTGQQ